MTTANLGGTRHININANEDMDLSDFDDDDELLALDGALQMKNIFSPKRPPVDDYSDSVERKNKNVITKVRVSKAGGPSRKPPMRPSKMPIKKAGTLLLGKSTSKGPSKSATPTKVQVSSRAEDMKKRYVLPTKYNFPPDVQMTQYNTASLRTEGAGYSRLSVSHR